MSDNSGWKPARRLRDSSGAPDCRTCDQKRFCSEIMQTSRSMNRCRILYCHRTDLRGMGLSSHQDGGYEKIAQAQDLAIDAQRMSASLTGRLGSSTFRLSAAAVSMSLTGSCFSSESALGPFHHGIRRRGGAIFRSALPADERQVQADMRTHLIHRPARDIIPPLGGARLSSYRV